MDRRWGSSIWAWQVCIDRQVGEDHFVSALFTLSICASTILSGIQKAFYPANRILPWLTSGALSFCEKRRRHLSSFQLSRCNACIPLVTPSISKPWFPFPQYFFPFIVDMPSISGSPPQLILDVQPGAVSVAYFIILDLVLLTIFDIALARTSSHLCYRRIFGGHPLELKSADIPGVTSFLLGNFWSATNIPLLLVKLVFLVFILIIDVEVNSESRQPTETITLTSRLGFDISTSSNNGTVRLGAGHLWPIATNCRVRSDDSDEITYYSVAYNFNDKKTSSPLHSVDENVIDSKSILCLSPKNVANESARPTVIISGCSPFRGGRCTDLNPKTIFERRPPADKDSRVQIKDTTGVDNLIYAMREYYNFTIISEYPSARMLCVSVSINPKDPPNNYLTYYDSCLLSANVSNGYLIENWIYNSSSFIRHYPGVVFKNYLNISTDQSVSTAFHLLKGGVSYETLSTFLIGYGSYHILESQNITNLGDTKTVSVIPVHSLVMSCVLAALCLGSYILVAIFLANERPQLNEINGLSSIAREENRPSGRSLKAGDGIAIGLILRNSNVARLVPVQNGYRVVSKKEVDSIV